MINKTLRSSVLDPDPHHGDADPQHCYEVPINVLNAGRYDVQRRAATAGPSQASGVPVRAGGNAGHLPPRDQAAGGSHHFWLSLRGTPPDASQPCPGFKNLLGFIEQY
jgi:hypothetical protein